MSMHMNSSAFSDDGKFSTRAYHREFGAVGHNEYIDNPQRRDLGEKDLSTQVEVSDKGSRRYTY